MKWSGRNNILHHTTLCLGDVICLSGGLHLYPGNALNIWHRKFKLSYSNKSTVHIQYSWQKQSQTHIL